MVRDVQVSPTEGDMKQRHAARRDVAVKDHFPGATRSNFEVLTGPARGSSGLVRWKQGISLGIGYGEEVCFSPRLADYGRRGDYV
ncbi:hypothetical protein SKAU_G00007920 [Synaphobranchus kaupii]|uniref:Uncharacterized protein n=1 Tax=Synaphobranchus kaupii TaxID=118154 RepID=A0A9Q1G9E3_SYNKA|nr:hypothetical protein SKAU_G00007920 [Synaphobranchus kaupii]